MKILITGASGYLGSALKRDLSTKHIVNGTYNSRVRPHLMQLDITNREQTLKTFEQEKPELVIHCAGVSSEFKNDPAYGKLINIEGTRNIVLASQEVGTSIIHMSSTAVFNGREGYFNEDDQPWSDDEYSQSKIAGENIVRSSIIPHCIIRPSLIFGDSPYGMEKKDFGKILQAINSKTSFELDNDWHFAPTWNKHISEVIDWWTVNQNKTNLLHVATAEITTKLKFARKLCLELGIDPSLFQEKEVLSHSGNNILDCGKLKKIGAPTSSIDTIISDIVTEIKKPKTPEGGMHRFGKERY